ncbi:MAG: PAS domain-containing protein [Alphaproteobacteria bacterium]|nr:MAG: PAS domain-containing protein [Alphaproteobacteria bacterium]
MHQDPKSIIDTLQQIHNGKTHIGEYLSLIFNNMPISVYWKDTNYIMQGCNQYTADLFDTSRENIIGKTEFDYVFNTLDAEYYRAVDKKVISQERSEINIIEPVHTSKDTCTLWSSTKMPYYDENGTVAGVVGFTMQINPAAFSSIPLINELQNLKNEENYYIHANAQIIRLTARQAECLMHLSMGKTFKQIALLIDREIRTVESHLESLKRKLGVNSTSALIDCFWKNPIKWF